MFIISDFASNTEVEMFTPLVDGIMDKAVLYTIFQKSSKTVVCVCVYTIPHLNQMVLHILQVLNFCLLNSMLYNAPACSTSLRTGHISAEIYFQKNDSSILHF